MKLFNDFLRGFDLDPSRVRLLRHLDKPKDARGRGPHLWHSRGRDAFGCFASFQSSVKSSPYGDADFACHFLPLRGSPAALFVGITHIKGQRKWDGKHRPSIVDEDVIAFERTQHDSGVNLMVYDLEWIKEGQDCAGRLWVDWGKGARAWFQRADKQPKTILEVKS